MNFDVFGFCGQKILLLCFDYTSQVKQGTTYSGGYEQERASKDGKEKSWISGAIKTCLWMRMCND